MIVLQKKGKKEINEHLRKILAEIKVQRTKADKKGLKFSSLTEEQLRKKLKSLKTPFVTSFVHTYIGSISSNFTLIIHIYNPDPVTHFNLTAYAFFGPANTISDIGLALISADEELNRMFAQIDQLNSGATESFSFNVRFPTGTPLGLHLINGFIFIRNPFDVGGFIDRISADMTITP
jgi:hypothetical protein